MSALRGTVYLVGAGPGDPGLITARGLDLLVNADVVVYDRLVDSRLLDRASEYAELVDVGKARGQAPVSQDEINRILVDRAQSGALVVRLKGGDPFLFGRGGEEALALEAAGVNFEVVPGITSALAAPAYAGIPVTHRGAASSVTIVTGTEANTTSGSAVPSDGGTVVVLMGWENIETIVEGLVREGRSPETPAAVIMWGTEPFQRTVTGTLGDIVHRASATDLRPPVVIVVGEVVRLRERMRWFDNRPLYGKRVLVTRARPQAGRLSEMLYREGALPLEAPAIRIEPLPDYSALDDRLLHLDEVDWVVFASANAVAAVFARMDALGLDARDFHSASVAAIGSETAASLQRRGIMADFVPERFVSESALEGMREFGMSGARVFYPRSQTGRETLPAGLADMGAEVDEVPAYVTVTARESAPMVAEILSQGVDAAVFTSSSTVKGLLALLDGDPARLDGAVIACVGPITAGTARDNGLSVDVVAEPHTIPGLVSALRAHYSKEVPVMTDFPVTRQRRLRRSAGLRDMVSEARVAVSDLVYPIFVTYGRDRAVDVEPMPGVSQFSVDRLAGEVATVVDLGIPAVLLFGIPDTKDELGSEAYADDGIIQEAIRTVKQAAPGLVVIADVCLCEYTSHGHCGVVADGGVDNDATLDLLARTAVSQAQAGADIVAPSAMMDGQVGAIRTALDGSGFSETTIMSYSAKYASAFYGPFRIAAESAPQFGDRHAYQMDHRNAREALEEIGQDLNEGADIVMVKPALSYLDVIFRAREAFSCPIAAYNVSGEYSMVKAAAENEWIDGDRIMMEIAASIKRAGADILITYHAKEIARILNARA